MPANGHLDYKMVYQSDKPWCFDEWATHCGGGLSVILKEHNIPTYDEPMMADIDVAHGRFAIHRREDLKRWITFAYSRGNLYACQMKKRTKLSKHQFCTAIFRNGKLNWQITSMQMSLSYCHREKSEMRMIQKQNVSKHKILYFDLVIFFEESMEQNQSIILTLWREESKIAMIVWKSR